MENIISNFKIDDIHYQPSQDLIINTTYVNINELDIYSSLKELKIDIIYQKYDSENSIYTGDKFKIGHLSGIYLDIKNMLESNISILDLLDSYSADTYAVYENIFSGLSEMELLKGFFFNDNNIFYISEIYIDENWRNIGIGTYTISNIKSLVYCLYLLKFKTTLLFPSPITSSKNEEYIKKETNYLYNFYKKLGFNTATLSEFMIKN